MTLIRPFRGLRPTAGHADDVAAPPYDVLNTEEARARAAGRPWSFLHISKPEIDLPGGSDPYSPAVYAKGAENLARMIAAGILARDAEPCYYLYRLTMNGHSQTGLVAGASVAAYDENRIRKHEFTRPDKEDDRVRQIEALNAETGPVFLAYPGTPALDSLLAQGRRGAAEVDIVADTGVRHELWVVRDATLIAAITTGFDALPALYVADGHHRSAAASRIAATRRGKAGSDSHEHFLSVIFPHHELRILDYNRVVRDLNGLTPTDFLARIRTAFTVEAVNDACKPSRTAEYGLYLPGQWYRLRLDPARIPADDPVARLDVSLLDTHLLAPILGITDPRRDKRIDFIGGIRGLSELERRVDSGEMAVAFALYATRMEDLMAVADSGNVMPPKSTWFEPKLADGLVSHVLD